jgi:oxygen-independent coproporphyrinogen-3 oxidase
MPAAAPDGEPAPADGALPAGVHAGGAPLGVYLHVPFCASRCGYCDFNTYVPGELGEQAGVGASRHRLQGGRVGGVAGGYVDHVLAEIGLARRVLGPSAGPVRTVFVGGGTPTLLPTADLARMLRAVDDELGLAPDAEVSTEANPESVDPGSLARLRAAGFTRVSFGMQSAAEHVLAALDRRHTPGRAQQCVAWAHDAGFAHVNLDLIYGAPGETDDDWRASLEVAIGAGPDHVSAYALVVEPGTALARRVGRGEVAAPDDDALADRYLIADEMLTAAGYGWYEVSNWARGEDARCRHNLGYWSGGDWWGAGPGAHSHVAGVRWWNVKHPHVYGERLAEGTSPAAAREVLSDGQRRLERTMLGVRLAGGLALADLDGAGRAAADRAGDDGLLVRRDDRIVLTRRGRLLADAVVRDLTG